MITSAPNCGTYLLTHTLKSTAAWLSPDRVYSISDQVGWRPLSTWTLSWSDRSRIIFTLIENRSFLGASFFAFTHLFSLLVLSRAQRPSRVFLEINSSDLFTQDKDFSCLKLSRTLNLMDHAHNGLIILNWWQFFINFFGMCQKL